MSDMKKILNSWLSQTKIDLRRNYVRTKRKASGNWGRELKEFTKSEPNKIKAGMMAPKYTGAITDGRSPNKNQDPEAIRKWVGWAGSTFLAEWVKNKGVSANPFAVAYKIATEGWQIPNKHNKGDLVSNVLTDKWIESLNKSLSLYFVENFKSDFKKIITK